MNTLYALTNLTIATMKSDAIGYDLINDGVIVVEGEMIAWVGARVDLPEDYTSLTMRDCGGKLATPSLIDCHTHIVHGGDRAKEFEMRLNGASYEEVARAGGGIVSTVTDTRTASEAELLEGALARVDALMAQGVSTIEVKSGYGLDVETELKMLRVARDIPNHRDIDVSTSFLGAHSAPKGMDTDHYIDEICIPTLERAHKEGLVDVVDGFCEGIAFNTDQIARVFDKAVALGLPVKLHAEQLSNIGGTKLAAKYNALSADHVEYANEDDAIALAKSGTVAVILPGAFYSIRETQMPPIAAFRKHNVPMAIATDWNPGSSPMGSLLLAMNMGCTLFRMTPEETLRGATINAAKALGYRDRGSLEVGKRADIAIWNAKSPAELSYHIGFNPLFQRIVKGQL